MLNLAPATPIMKSEPAGIFLCSYNRFSREGLRHMLDSFNLAIVGEAGRLHEAQMILSSLANDVRVLLFETSSELAEDLAALAAITQDFPHIAAVVLSGSPTSSDFSSAIAAGAHGYLPNEISAEALQISLQLILLGESIVPMSMLTPPSGHLVGEMGCEPDRLRSPLSGRETQILKRLETGLPNKVIARDLEMAEATVKVHIKAILRKIQVQNRTQAAIWSMNNRDKINQVDYS